VFDLAAIKFYQHRLIHQDFQFDPDLKREAENFIRQVKDERYFKNFFLIL
jgi:hypothetical protein